MKGLSRKSSTARTLIRQVGFTLVEMLVVVGIIVALAAVIIPSVAVFIGKGNEGAEGAERDIIQKAMYALMAGEGVTKVDATGSSDPAVRDFTDKPTIDGVPAPLAGLAGYLTQDETAYWYCWDSSGKITQLTESGTCG